MSNKTKYHATGAANEYDDASSDKDVENRLELFPNYCGPDITDEVLKDQVQTVLSNVVTFVNTNQAAEIDSRNGDGSYCSTSGQTTDAKSESKRHRKQVWIDSSDNVLRTIESTLFVVDRPNLD